MEQEVQAGPAWAWVKWECLAEKQGPKGLNSSPSQTNLFLQDLNRLDSKVAGVLTSHPALCRENQPWMEGQG